jgi:prepilin-type N-terminal cleavage/methylation domain-containing protein
MSRTSRRRLTEGFTLLEMLVTLVILSLVATILSQALGQLARIERQLEGTQLRSVAVSLRAEWVRAALAGLMPGTTPAEQVAGSEREVQGMSSEVPRWPAPGLARLHLRLVTDDRAGVTRLELLPESGDRAAPVVLLQWAGQEGRFLYLDAKDRWSNRWPPLSTTTVDTGTAAPALAPMPRAVALDTGPAGPGFLVAVPLASPSPPPTRAALEAM